MLLSDGQGGTVNPLVDLLPLLCLEGVEAFPSVTHSEDREQEGKVSGIPPCGCASSVGQLWLYRGPRGQGSRHIPSGGKWTYSAVLPPSGLHTEQSPYTFTEEETSTQCHSS